MQTQNSEAKENKSHAHRCLGRGLETEFSEQIHCSQLHLHQSQSHSNAHSRSSSKRQVAERFQVSHVLFRKPLIQKENHETQYMYICNSILGNAKNFHFFFCYLSGLNLSGSGKCSGSLCIANGLKTTKEPLGR